MNRCLASKDGHNASQKDHAIKIKRETVSKTPNLVLPTSNGGEFQLQCPDAPTVLFFYPKADTPGCTTESKDFSLLKDEFDALGVEIAGISPDKPAKLEKFIAKHDLTVTLVSDESLEAANALGVWVEKSMYGKKYMGIERSTFLIGKGGSILEEWRKVRVKDHANKVLETVRGHFG